MKSFNYFSLSIFFLLIFFSCSPKPILEITTLETDKEYYNGNEFVGKSDSTALVFLEFIEQNFHQYVYYLQIENVSERTYLYTADNNFSKTYHTKERLDNDKYNMMLYAVDPEEKIKQINSDIKSRETRHAISTGCNCLGGLFSAASSIASEDDEDDANVADWIVNQEEENIDYENDIYELNSEREFWKTEVLRKNTLHPAEVIGGLVFIKKDIQAKYFKVFINVDNSQFEFLYHQRRIN
jgi:hypothetical protein